MPQSVEPSDLGGLRVAAETTDGALVLRLDGELDLAGAPRLAAAIESSAQGPVAELPLVIDLSGVSFMDSTGVRALVDAGRDARGRARPFALMRPSPAVSRVLDLVDLRRAFVEIEDLGAESLARANGPAGAA